jgi:hypothetical protein
MAIFGRSYNCEYHDGSNHNSRVDVKVQIAKQEHGILLYLADMASDGLTDMIRIRNGKICYWPNLGYGRFGAKATMDNCPWSDNPDQFDQIRIRLAEVHG